jgi:signal transduction histidine kinase
MAILSGVCLSGIYIAEEMGILPEATFTELTDFDDIFTMGILLGVTALFIYFAMRNLSSSLERARMSEHELRRLNEELEQRVVERTSELQAANEHLTILSQVKDEFVSNVSHELRTPITNLKLYHDMLEKKPQAAPQYIIHLKRETDRLARLIDDLLFLSRLDQNRTEMTFEQVDLNQLVKDLVADRILLAESRQLSLKADIQAETPAVWAEERMISQVLSILLTNALTYTPPGGEVDVLTHFKQEDNLILAGFSVRDNGYGITEEECKRLFERFYRGQAAQTANANGAGLGLAIAKEIVERHNGTIDVKSNGSLGKGTIFTVWLPTQNKPRA